MTFDTTCIPWLVALSAKDWAATAFYVIGICWMFKNWRLRRKKK